MRLTAILAAAAAVALTPAAAAPSRVVLVRLVSPSLGFVATSTGSRTRLLVGDGRSWRDVTPPHVRFQPEDLVFLDRRHGWFVTNDCVAGRAIVDRTVDGGRTWTSARVRPTNCAAGSALALSFADRVHGWLVRTFENAPGAELARTVDGGRTWSRARELPLLGRVAFQTPRDGWLGRSDVRAVSNLFVTTDGGLTWRPRTLPRPAGWRDAQALPDVPTFFGAHGVLPVSLFTPRRSGVAFYVTSDGGRSWRAQIVVSVGFRTLLRLNPFPRYVPTAVASPSGWWVVSRIATPRVLVTSDAGRHWRASRPGLAGARFARIDAVGTTSAWLTLGTCGGGTRLLATRDGGRSWRRLR
ncbi:MAG TPA: hypothetical protein VE596_15395 [Gaiellaceae bacterium]|jgi:photosystem II stability/assembly factor-like uncharacterized protein|nr:hypothetical protein [Gaiellaceae bacterium]